MVRHCKSPSTEAVSGTHQNILGNCTVCVNLAFEHLGPVKHSHAVVHELFLPHTCTDNSRLAECNAYSGCKDGRQRLGDPREAKDKS